MDARRLHALLEDPLGPALVPWLESRGYRLLEREHGWHECLIVGNGESWTGHGLSREDALERALGAAFPSHGARWALLHALEATPLQEAASPSTQEIGTESHTLAPPPGGTDTAEDEVRPPLAPHAPPGVQADSGSVPGPNAQGEERPAPSQPAALRDEHTETPVPLPDVLSSDGIVIASDFLDSPAGAVPAPRGERAPILVPPMDDGPAREELQDLLAAIESQKEAFACLAPGRQRLVLLGWLARARGLQDEHPRSIPLSAEVGRLVKVLRGMSESCWPGMISAFQIRARPMDSAKDLRPFAGSVPMSWMEVAEAAAEAVRQMEEKDEEDGRDRDGWADHGQLFPPPPSPDLMLHELESEIEEFGPIGTRQPKEGPRPDAEQIGNWARRLRWLRQDATDKILWGALAGRLRYWAQEAPFEVRQLLDPTFRPGRSWATLVRSGEEEARQQEELAIVLRATPAADAPDGAIVAWVGSLLPLPADHTEAILAAARPIRHRILNLELDESHFPGADRRSRRRLQKILEALRPTEGEEEEAAPAETAAALPSPAVDNEPPAQLLARTRGQRVLFVSNRSDSQLQEKLQSAFEFKQLDWAEATPRRVEAATEAIAAGTYDLVLGATGFLSHKEDGRLQRVCKSAGVPYIRANRGRPGAVQLALTRDLLGSYPSDSGRLPS